MTLTYRSAVPDGIAECIDLRGKTRENSISVERLRALGITHESWRGDVAAGNLPGCVCLEEGKIVGYCFGNKMTGEIAVLAFLPEWEGKGIGRRLLTMVVDDFAKLGFRRVFLGCSSNPKVRSYGFYRHLGWKSTGSFDYANDEILEYFPRGK
ncbi:MAG TPA: GNAT family N-acetyltransferase [Steroidobacteraceae bacterium]|nr:GNAT family N-acetyltransferase [Steroidobacteraceae bacterium]